MLLLNRPVQLHISAAMSSSMIVPEQHNDEIIIVYLWVNYCFKDHVSKSHFGRGKCDLTQKLFLKILSPSSLKEVLVFHSSPHHLFKGQRQNLCPCATIHPLSLHDGFIIISMKHSATIVAKTTWFQWAPVAKQTHPLRRDTWICVTLRSEERL